MTRMHNDEKIYEPNTFDWNCSSLLSVKLNVDIPGKYMISSLTDQALLHPYELH